jgi:aldehyde reductase
LGTRISATEAVRYAVEVAGHRHVDCARFYQNEESVGIALNDLLSRYVGRRDQIWSTSKVWFEDFSPEDVEPACHESLRRTDGKLNIIAGDIIATYIAVQRLVDIGLIKHLVDSNFTIALLEKLGYDPHVTIKPYTIQVEIHL